MALEGSHTCTAFGLQDLWVVQEYVDNHRGLGFIVKALVNAILQVK